MGHEPKWLINYRQCGNCDDNCGDGDNDSCREDGNRDDDGDGDCEDEVEDHELRRRVGVTTRRDSDE